MSATSASRSLLATADDSIAANLLQSKHTNPRFALLGIHNAHANNGSPRIKFPCFLEIDTLCTRLWLKAWTYRVLSSYTGGLSRKDGNDQFVRVLSVFAAYAS